MRTRIVLVAALGLAAAVAVPPAGAAPAPVPAPTVTVKVSSQGVTLPNSTMKATWNGTDLGHIGELIVDGKNLPGTTTAIDALWTSKEYTSYSHVPSFEFTILNTHSGYTSASMPAGFRYGVRARPAGRAWLPWRDVSVAYNSGVVGGGYAAKPRLFAPVADKHKVQWQWRMNTELSDVSQEHQEWKLVANIP